MFMDKKFLKMRDGTELYVEVKEVGSPVWIIATHGIAEHLGRHKYIKELFGHDFNVFQYDLRGHGRSSGKRVWVENFSDYMEDLKEITKFLQEKYRMKRYILFGHSMGAQITCAFIQNHAEADFYPERVVINAPPCGADGIFGQVLKLVPSYIFNRATELPFSFMVPGLVNLNFLSHDPRVKEEYLKDELAHLKLDSKLIFELMKNSQSTFSRPLRVKCPAFVSVGSGDRVVGVSDLLDFFNNVDKAFQVKIIDGAFHEIHNEIEKYKKPYLEYLKATFNEVLYKEN